MIRLARCSTLKPVAASDLEQISARVAGPRTITTPSATTNPSHRRIYEMT